MKILNHVSFIYESKAVPLSIQKSAGYSSEGKSIVIIKIVDKPVVESVPTLDDILYTGQLKIFK